MKKKHLTYILHAAILIGVGVAAFKYLNGVEIFKALRDFNYSFAPLMLLLSAGYLALKSWRFVILMRPITDIHWNIIFRAFAAGQAATFVPGGIAARAGLMKQVGVPAAKSVVPVALSSALDQAVFIVGSLIAALWFPFARTPALILLIVLTIVGTIAAIPTTRHWVLDRATWAASKFNLEEEFQRFLEAIPEVATVRVIGISLAITIVAMALRVIILDLSMRGMDLSVSYPKLVLAFILPTMLGRIFPVPGGVGVTEASMVGFLNSAAQINVNVATAAVAIFRIVAIAFPALLGALVYFFGWQGEQEVATSTTS